MARVLQVDRIRRLLVHNRAHERHRRADGDLSERREDVDFRRHRRNAQKDFGKRRRDVDDAIDQVSLLRVVASVERYTLLRKTTNLLVCKLRAILLRFENLITHAELFSHARFVLFRQSHEPAMHVVVF